MATQDIIQQLIGVVAKNPQILTSLMNHPYSTVAQVTGEDREISKQEAAQVVAATSALASGQAVDFSQLAGVASQLLGQNNNSVHAMSSNLLGNVLGLATPQKQPSLQESIIGNLLGVAFNGTQAQAKAPIDLSDGFGLDDVIGLAGLFMRK